MNDLMGASDLEKTVELPERVFHLFRRYIHDLCGIVIPDSKSYLIRQRLRPLVAAARCRSFGEFYEEIGQRRLPKIDEQVVNAITTKETSFFRDRHPFVAFKEYILPWLGEKIRERKARKGLRRGPKVSIWSAGSSTGQEPYSLAMLIHEYALANRHLGIFKEDFGLLATDVSSDALSKAVGGEYTHLEMKRGLPADYRHKYFVQDGACWVLDGAIRTMVEFRQVNLIKPFATLGGFDVILCRNVMIYFDGAARAQMICQFHNMLSDGGVLLLGGTESLRAVSHKSEGFKPVYYGKTLLYKRNGKR